MTAPKHRLTPVPARPRLADEVSSTLRQEILRGAYEPGARLSMEEIAEQLGVSIMPVREALLALQGEGLVSSEPRRGFRAAPLDQLDLEDIFEIQANLSGILAARAAAHATDEDIAELRRLHERLVSAATSPVTDGQAARLDALNTAFHRYLNKISPDDRLRWLLRFTTRFVRQDLFDALPGVTEHALEEHPAIIEAIADRDPDRAQALVAAHFLQGSGIIGYTLPRDPGGYDAREAATTPPG